MGPTNPSPADSDSQLSDPDYQQQEDVHSYFTAPNPITKRQRWLVGFYKYLNTLDCGSKTSKNCFHHAAQPREILENLDPNGTDLNILSEDEGYKVLTDWVDPKMEELSYGTIRSYLCSFEMFLTHVSMERIRPGQVPDLPTDVKLILKATIPKLKGWRKTVDFDMRAERSEKRLKECDTRLTTKDVATFMNSKVMVDAAELLERARHGQSLTTLELCLIRDMLLAELTITTGTRPGALGNATIRHFRSSRCDLQTQLCVMLVGPAHIIFIPEVQGHMDMYVEFVRPQFNASPDGVLFVTADGTPFTKDTICRRLPEIWKRSGVRPDLGVTATNIPKWIVTVCHKAKVKGLKFDENALRLAMCHSQETAQTFYLRQDVTEVAARATEIIQRCTTTRHVAAEAAPAAPPSSQPATAEPPAESAQQSPSPPPEVETELLRCHTPASLDPVLGSPLPGLQTPHVASSDSEDLEEEKEPLRQLSASEGENLGEFQDWIQTIFLEVVRFQLRNR